MTAKNRRPYVQVDVDLPDHPKVLGVSAAARWLFVVCITQAGRGLTDGHVRAATAVAAAEVDKRALAALVKAGLIHEPGHGCPRCPQPAKAFVYVHDYAEHQRTRAEVEQQKAKLSHAGKKAAAARWGQRAEEEDPWNP